LGYEWDKVHVEADRLEHVISEKFEESIAQVLGNPSHDPHGDPIPTRELDIPKTPTFPLAKLQPGQTAMIHRVNSTDANLLRYLGKLGLMPQVQIIALEYSPYDQNLSVQVVGTDKTIVLGPKITYQIYIEVIENT
jgi:DtxR family Mn-dependent transcriptional regulator